MKAYPRSLPLPILAIAIGCWLSASPSPAADPPARKFLEALRERQYYDVGLEYLEDLRKNDRCPPDLKEAIDYEIGMLHLDAASAVEGAAERDARLEAATASLQEFLGEYPGHELALSANTQIGKVLLLRGAGRAQAADQPGLSSAEKTKRLDEARALYTESQSALLAAENLCYQKARELKEKADSQPSSRAKSELDQAYGELLQTRLLLANVADQQARTHPPGSKDFTEPLAAAAAKYHELFEKYGNLVGGLQARMFEGRAYKDLDENQKAIDIFLEMLTLPDQPAAFANLKNQSLIHLLETYIKPDVEKYDEALRQAESWRDAALPHQVSGLEGRQIQLLAARAAMEAARRLKAGDQKRRDLLRMARRHLEFVLRFAGATKAEAGSLLADDMFGGEIAEVAEVAEPADFAEAFEQLNLAWIKMLTLAGQAQQEQDPQRKAELARQTDALRPELIRLCQSALRLADGSTPIAERNTIRFRLTYLYFLDDDLYRAAVLGEFLAYRYPTSIGARKGAEIAIKAYRKLFDTERRASRDTSFELGRMRRLAEYTAARWEGEPESGEAWLMLIDTAIDLGDLEDAREYLEKLSSDSNRRAQAELRLGQALWSKYLREAALEEGRPSRQDLERLTGAAKQTLRQGIDRMRKAVDAGGSVGYPLVFSVLALSQLLIDDGQAEEAVHWLDDPKIGPMALVAAGHPAVAGRTEFQIDAFKAALRAYVGAKKLEEAERAMNALEQRVGQESDGGAGRRLTHIYIALGRQLEEMLTRLRHEGKTQEMQQVSEGFELFLDRIAQRQEGNSFNSLNWVAETLFSLGSGLDPGDGSVPQQAQEYYTKAGATFYKILKEKPDDMPEGAEANIQVRLAACLRAMGKHKEALALLVSVLAQRETRVDVQIEAARTYQEFARATGQPDFYFNAILGGQKQPDGRYLVWGWNGIANRVASYDEYRSIFHEARYNIALCRTRLAQAKTGEERSDLLRQAELDITRTYQLYPKMGGPEWFEKYDALLKAIRKYQGQPNPRGLRDAG